MWETDLEKLQTKESLRETIQFLRKEAKDKEKAASLKAELKGGVLLVSLLSEEDAKVRKGAALLLGELGIQEAADALWNAYESEQTLFVKSAYLTALGKLDFSEFIPDQGTETTAFGTGTCRRGTKTYRGRVTGAWKTAGGSRRSQKARIYRLSEST